MTLRVDHLGFLTLLKRPLVHGPIGALVLVSFGIASGFNSYDTFLLMVAVLYAIGALGLNLSAGFLGQLSLGQGAAFGLGAYISAILSLRGWPIVVSIPAAVAGGLALGIVMGLSSLRLGFIGVAMMSLGLTLVLGDATLALTSLTGGPSGLSGIAPRLLPSTPKLGLEGTFFVLMIAGTATYIGHWWYRTSNLGRASLAVKGNEVGASAIGLSPYFVKVIGFGVGTAVGALAGSLYPYVTGVVSPDSFGVSLSVLLLLMVVVGGSATRVGPIAGALVVGIVPIILASYPSISPYIYGTLLIVTVRLMPRGIVRRTGAPVGKERPRATAALPIQRPASYDAAGREPVLELRGISRSFGGNVAVDALSLNIEPCKVLGLVGPNGSGKTTVLNVISGYYPPQSGSILLRGKPIQGLRPHEIARRGVGRTFQVPRVFPDLTVAEHLALARRSLVSDPAAEVCELGEGFAERIELLGTYSSSEARTLSHGHLRFLELSMALLRGPRILLLDEPAAGLSGAAIANLDELVRSLASCDVGVILVEHHLGLVRGVADEIGVLHLGRLLWVGVPDQLEASEKVREAYLGPTA